MEQELGHKTHYQNLRAIFQRMPDFKSHWILPEMRTSGMVGRLPLVRSNWTLQASLQTRQGLSRLTKEVRPELLFFHTQVTAVLARDYLRRYPSIVSLDATPLQYDALGEAYDHRSGPGWLEDYKLQLYRSCFDAASHLVTWSQWAKDGLTAGYGVPPEKITVIPPGVDLQQWSRPSRHTQERHAVKILFVGGNLERKGGYELLEAFRHVREQLGPEDPQLELHMVTKDTVPDQPDVFPHYGLKPNTSELKELYFSSDIFCLPTHGDCLPMALAEAGAAGMPVVSTRVAAIPELVVDRENGYLIQPGDTNGLVKVLERLAKDPSLRAAMGARSCEIVSADHNVERNAAQLSELFKTILYESKR